MRSNSATVCLAAGALEPCEVCFAAGALEPREVCRATGALERQPGLFLDSWTPAKAPGPGLPLWSAFTTADLGLASSPVLRPF